MREIAADFIDVVLSRAELSHVKWIRTYSARRLNEGESEYGTGAFRDADCAKEAMEEGVDGANWAALEFVRRWEVDDIDEFCVLLTSAAADYARGAEKLALYRDIRSAKNN